MWKNTNPAAYSEGYAENPDTFGKGLSRRSGAAFDCRYVQAHARRRTAWLDVYDGNQDITGRVNGNGIFYGLQTAACGVYRSRQLLAAMMENRLRGADMSKDTLRAWLRSIRLTRICGGNRQIVA